MGKFPIQRTQRGLPGASGSVRANYDTADSSGIGAAVGEGIIVGIGILKEREKKRTAIELKRQEMIDGNNAVAASNIRKNADTDYENFKINNLEGTWQAERNRIDAQALKAISELPFSTDAMTAERVRVAGWASLNKRKALGDATRQLQLDTIDAQTKSLVGAFRSGTTEETDEAVKRYRSLGANMGKDNVEVENDIIAARAAGMKGRAEDFSNKVYAAIEQASEVGGDFEEAKELAKSPFIPEDKQATLRSAIKTAELSQKARLDEDSRVAKETATSTAIREWYQGDMSIGKIDKQHEEGLISDSAFMKIREGLEAKIPDLSDPVARSTVNRTITNFKRGAATKQELDAVLHDAYPLLDEPDRKKFADSIETVYNTGVENSIHEAKTRGASIISQKFKGLLVTPKFDNADDIKQFENEWTLRNLYEDSLDDWVAQQVKKGVDPTPRQVRVMANDLLIDYNKMKGLSKIEGNIEAIRKGLSQGKIIGTEPLTAKSNKPPKSEKDMTTEEIKARLERLIKKK